MKIRIFSTNSLILFLLVGLIILFNPKNAYAYLDPGSGSYLTQIILASLLGLAFVVKSSWRNIRKFITNIIKKCEWLFKKIKKGRK